MAQKIWKKSEISFLYQRSSFILVDITCLHMLFILVAITDVRFWTYLALPIYNNSDWNFCPSVFFHVAKLLWQRRTVDTHQRINHLWESGSGILSSWKVSIWGRQIGLKLEKLKELSRRIWKFKKLIKYYGNQSN